MHIRWLVQAQCCFLISILNVFITLTGGHELLKRLFRYRILYHYFLFPQILWMGQNLCGSRICSFFAIGYCKRIWEYTNWLLSDLDRFSGFRVSNFRASPWFHNSRPCKFYASIFLIFYCGMSYVWHRPLPPSLRSVDLFVSFIVEY